MQYTEKHYTEYRVMYIDTAGTERDTFCTYKSESAANKYIARQSKPSYVERYFVKPQKVVHQQLIPLQ